MYQYKDHNAFARQLIEMAIDPVVAEREYVELTSEDEYSDYLTLLKCLKSKRFINDIEKAKAEVSTERIKLRTCLHKMDVL